MRNDLSIRAKQTFQVVAFFATVLVVGIHYKSDIPDGVSPVGETWNELAQEFLFGGIARVAVPLFAFAAGFFYFRSDDGTLACYRKKWTQRCRTVATPYFWVASFAMFCWLMIRRFQGETVDWSWPVFISHWLLHPPAEQLWFLRDLMVLVTFAPLIGWLGKTPLRSTISLTAFALAWTLNWQPFPEVLGWKLLQMETLFFFALGCPATRHVDQIESLCRLPRWGIGLVVMLWSTLVAARILVRADFDTWYVDQYGWHDLVLHQASIVVGCIALFAISSRMLHPLWIGLSGVSFFVFLVHEFPLRAVAHRVVESVADPRWSCWYVTPAVLLGCSLVGLGLSRWFPKMFAFLTGGRTPTRAFHITDGSSESDSSSEQAHTPLPSSVQS